MNSRTASSHGRTPTDADVVDRLARLRTIVPLLAADLAAARRRAHTLELDNRRLTRRVTELEAKLANMRTCSRRDAPDRLAASAVAAAPVGSLRRG